MKKIYSILVALLLTANLFAQAPQKMSYQAVIRKSNNALVASLPVGLKISILKGSATGTAVYVETQTATTNANGLVSFEIGMGTAITGTFASINWATGPYFIKTETDPIGGTAYTIAGTNELMSVPYALFSASGTSGPQGPAGATGATGAVGATGATGLMGPAGPQGLVGLTGAVGPQGPAGAAGTNAGVGGFTHYLGEAFNGGIIYYLYKGSDGLEHGLIVALTESTAAWQTTGTLVNANRTEDGAYNTTLMTGSPAATYIAGLGAGWYLPSIDELGLLYDNRYSAQKGLRTGGNTLLSNTTNYWSSTENTASHAYYFSVGIGYGSYASSQYGFKATQYTVRGVRAF
jgi:hypothetical protein